MLSPESPLWLPPGSIRSVLAMAVVAGYFAGLVQVELVTMVLAFYFAARTAATT